MLPETGYTALSWIYVFLTLCLVINRLYVRATRREGDSLANWSDTLVVLAWLFNALQVILDTVMYAHDAMQDPDYMDPSIPGNPEKMDIFRRLYYAENVIYYIPLYLIKLAILCFLLEITPPVLVKIRKAIWVGFGLTSFGTLLVIAVYTFVQCQPVASWLQRSCHVAGLFSNGAIGWHMLTDVYIYALPFFLVRRLTLISRSQRVGTWIMFGTGFLLVGLGFMQLAIFPTLMWSFWWALHEQTLAVTIACLPSLRVTLLQLRRSSRNRAGSRESCSTGHTRKSLPKRMRRGELQTNEVADIHSAVSNPLNRSGLSLEKDAAMSRVVSGGTDNVV